MKFIKILTLLFVISSCETRTVKYTALNDLVIGAQSVVLYENGEFYLELGAGGVEGTYTISHDTVNLRYYDKPDNWPDQLLMTKEYFYTIKTEHHIQTIKISRANK